VVLLPALLLVPASPRHGRSLALSCPV
jgi:hypothetical protein